MPTDNNEKRTGGRLRVGLLASAIEQPPLLRAIRAVSGLELCGQAGSRASAAAPAVPHFDDPRVMLAQGGVELLVLGLSTREACEHAGAALDYGVHVWRRPPLGRTFAEAAAAARLAMRNRPVYRIASHWEAVEPAVRGLLTPGEEPPSYCDLFVSAAGPPADSWRASRGESGGGVLINDGYAALEALIALRGLPATVSSAVGAFRQRRGAPVRDGEDTVAAILRFDDGAVAAVRCGWDMAAGERWAVYHGEQWSLTLRAGGAVMRRGEDGAEQAATHAEEPWGDDLARTFHAIRSADAQTAAVERHVAVAALIDTIYLAARTHQPESPHKLYEVQGWPLPAKR